MPVLPLKAANRAQVPDAPTFYPSEDEFSDPLAYIASLRLKAEQYGACKIVPPASWKPPFALDRSSFRFNTRVQSVHELQERSRAEDEFEEDYLAWLGEVSRTWKGPPMVNGREVDVYRLFKAVGRRGGYHKVTESKAWKEVCKVLEVREKNGTAASTVRQLYHKHLLGYEERCTKRRVKREPSRQRPAHNSGSSFEDILAAANGKEDMELLGAVAALMDVPAADCDAHRGNKLDAAETRPTRDPLRVPGNIHTMVCELCKGGHREDKIILCDQCDRGCHIFCLQPPLTDIPEGTWICPLCVAEEVDTRAFRDGKEVSLENFEALARDFKNDWFGGESAAEQVSLEDIEREFWAVVETGEEPVEVMYGADIDTSRSGSGFPIRAPEGSTTEPTSATEYAESPWNLNNLPRLGGSLLKYLDDNIAGVTLPWMYVGMMFSSFCWHIEDHMFYSVNYNHWGAPKRWYSVPSSAAEAFEAAFKAALPELFEKQPDVLFHLVTMLSPRILQTAEVPVFGLTQRPGEFVVTFPCSYHGGFNMGLNCAEAVNFAPSDWLRFGTASTERIQAFRKQPIVAQAWLLLKVAESDAGGELAYWAAKDLQRVLAHETEWRLRLLRSGVLPPENSGCFQSRRVEQGQGLQSGSKEDAQCAICQGYLHLSGVECKCCPRRFVCMRHASSLCDCPPSSWRLAFRHSLIELRRILEGLSARIPAEMLAEPPVEMPPPVETEKAASAGSDAEMEEEEPLPQLGTDSDEDGCAPEIVVARQADAEETAMIEARAAFAELDGSSPVEADPADASPTYPEIGPLLPPPIPRKRDRKANRNSRPAKRHCVETEERPQLRITRAAIKAEEEAQDTMDVLTALTASKQMIRSGLADMAEMCGPPPALERRTPEANGSAEGSQAAAVAPEDAKPAEGPAEERLTDAAPAPDDFDVDQAMADLTERHRAWVAQADGLLASGGARAGDIEALIQRSSQFMWATDELQAGVPELVQRLRDAQAWSARVHACLKNRPALEDAEAVLVWRPPPISVPGFVRFAEGVGVARLWRARAAEAGSGVVELRALESLVAEGQRLPVQLPELKAPRYAAVFKEGRAAVQGLKERLLASRQLLEAVKVAMQPPGIVEPPAVPQLPAPEKMRSRRKNSKHSQHDVPDKSAPPQPQVVEITLEWLRVLRNQAGVLRVQFPDLAKLNQAISDIEAFQAKIKEAMQVKPSLPTLHELVAGAEGLIATVPEMQRIRSLITEASNWLNRARNVTQSRTALKKMREVLHAGLRLGSELPEVERLRQEIRRREWEDHARRALTNKQTLTALAETLDDAAAMGAENTDLALGVRKRLEEARAWEEEATRFFAAPGRAPLIALEALVDSGNALGVRMDRLTQANQALSIALAWSHKAEQAAMARADTPLQLRPSLVEVETLLAEYKSLVVALPEAESLTRKRDEAQAWRERAKAVLAAELSEDQIGAYERLVAAGWSTGVQMEELVAMQDCLAALEWMREIRKYTIVTALRPKAAAAALLPEANGDRLADTTAQATAESLGHCPTSGEGPIAEGREPSQPELQARPASVAAEQPDGPISVDWEPSNAQPVVGRVPDGNDAEAGESPGTPPGRLVMTVDEAKQLVEEGEGLPVDQDVLSLLRRNLELVSGWEARLAAVSSSQDEAAQEGLSSEALTELVAEARGMLLQPESLPALEDALHKTAAWQARAERLFREGERPRYAEVVAVALSGRELLVRAGASGRVDEVVAEGEAWREACRKAIAKRNSGQRLSRCIKAATGGLEMALEQLAMRMQDEAARPLPEGATQHSEAEAEEDERALYCVCQQPYNVDTAMIGCDSCEEWFHCRCVGLSQAAARSIKKYVCPVCLALRGNGKELEAALGRTRQTRRPSVDVLAGLIDDAASLPCIMDETSGLSSAIAMFDRWSRTADALLDGHMHGLAAVRRLAPGPPVAEQPASDGAERSVSPDDEATRPPTGGDAAPLENGLHSASAEANAGAKSGPRSAEDAETELGASGAMDIGVSHEAAGDAMDGGSVPAESQPGSPAATAAAADPADGVANSGPQHSQQAPPFEPGEPRVLSLKTLSQLVKSVLSLEVAAGEVQKRLMGALKQQRWRRKVETVLHTTSKHTAEAVSRLQREGESIGVDMESDCWGVPLTALTTKLHDWQERAEAVAAELSECGDDKAGIARCIQEAEELMRSGRAGFGLEPPWLPRGFEKELSKLEEACKLYCLCQAPYNEDRPMLGCDYCQEWFHYDCVGLRAPSDDEDDADVAPEDFRCPQCCHKAGKRYPQQDRLPAKSLDTLGMPAPAIDFQSSRELAGGAAASRLQEMLTPSQAQALGEAQQAMLSGDMRVGAQPAHSWLLSVLAQQQRLRPAGLPAPGAVPGFAGDPAAGVGLAAPALLPGFQAPPGFVLPHFAHAQHFPQPESELGRPPAGAE